MSKVDWSKAPDGAEFFCTGDFYKLFGGTDPFYFNGSSWEKSRFDLNNRKDQMGYEERPASQFISIGEIVEAHDFLSEGMKILGERGRQYGSDNRECSFPQVAQAFNAITGNNLKGSDVCLILALVKQVRQYAQPERFHEDSAVDGVNYTALQAQELKKERK